MGNTLNKEKQIEEMAKDVCHLDRTCDECMTSFECKAMIYAKRFYNAGYRKSTDVAEKIFAEIEAIPMENMPYAVYLNIHNKIAELKKKYTESEDKAKL